MVRSRRKDPVSQEFVTKHSQIRVKSIQFQQEAAIAIYFYDFT